MTAMGRREYLRAIYDRYHRGSAERRWGRAPSPPWLVRVEIAPLSGIGRAASRAAAGRIAALASWSGE